MSLVDDFDLSNYETEDELNELLRQIDHEQATLRGYERGARDKLDSLMEADDEQPTTS